MLIPLPECLGLGKAPRGRRKEDRRVATLLAPLAPSLAAEGPTGCAYVTTSGRIISCSSCFRMRQCTRSQHRRRATKL
jgi:hypothetical protein